MSLKPVRSRALDTSKPLPVFRREELGDVDIQPARGIQYILTGMEKQEEEEKHLQEILTAQVLGVQEHTENLIIPTPEYKEDELYSQLYKGSWRKPSQYVHAQPFFHEDYPLYDLDEEDSRFLKEEVRERWKLDLTETGFEEMITQLETNSGLTTLSLSEAKLILKEDDDLILLVYEYWIKKKLRLQHNLVPKLRAERIGCTADKRNPYVAFRRRFEKMQTRRNRKFDENSYTVMLKLRRDLHRAVTLLGFVKKRERLKKAGLQLDLECLERRVEAEDWDGLLYNEVTAARFSRIESVPCQEMVSEDDISVVDSDYESDEGPFSFRRRPGVEYLAPLQSEPGDKSRMIENLDHGSDKDRFIWTQIPGICVAYCRRRVGRGGRVVIDRCSPVKRLTGMSSWSSPGSYLAAPHCQSTAFIQEWDPYKTRCSEIQDMSGESGSSSSRTDTTSTPTPETRGPWRSRSRSGGIKTINMDRLGAHNAASAILNSQFIDLFNIQKSSSDAK